MFALASRGLFKIIHIYYYQLFRLSLIYPNRIYETPHTHTDKSSLHLVFYLPLKQDSNPFQEKRHLDLLQG